MVYAGGVIAVLINEQNRRSEEINRRRFNEEKELQLLKEEQLRVQLREVLRINGVLHKENEFLRTLLCEKRIKDAQINSGVYLCEEHPEEW